MPLDPTVTVSRTLLRKIIPLAARSGTRGAAVDLSLTAESLILRQATGYWEVPTESAENVAGEITVRLSGVVFGRLRKFPAEDPLPVSIDQASSRIRFGSLSLPCLVSPPPLLVADDIADPSDPFEILRLAFRYEADAIGKAGLDPLVESANRELDRRVRAAGTILTPLGVSADAVRRLCVQRIQGGRRAFAPIDKKLLQQITKAWLELATVGVSPEDLKMLVMQAVQNAWKTKKVAK